MDNNYLDKLKIMDYAGLSSEMEQKLRELEKQFNTEFGKDYYFMVMKKKLTGF